jgi:serine/threonine-protein kinase
MDDQLKQSYEFGSFRLDAAKRCLLRDDKIVPLTPKAFDTLLLLVEHNCALLEKDELIKLLWPDSFVEENNLTQNISALRKAFGERPGEHRFIVTVPGRGYRFVADVRTCTGADTETKTTYVSPSRVIAVVPFKPLVTSNRDEAFEMGMADTLIARLSNIREIIVRPLSSVRKYGSLEQDPQAAGRELKVESVLDGSLQRLGDHLRVTARLINVADGTSLWTGTFDEKFTDVFDVQDVISEKVTSALALRLSSDEKRRLAKRYTENTEAYHLYLTGRYHWGKLTPPHIRKSIEYFQQAIEIDPIYALAYGGLAEAYRSLPMTSDVPPADAFPQAKAAASKALELDESLADVHATLGFVKFWFDWDWADAERECQRAVELNPNSGDAHRAYAHLLSDLGRHGEAIAEAKQARELDPLSLLTNALEGQFLYYANQDDEALIRFQKTLELEPNFWIAHLMLSKVYIRRQMYPEALAELSQAKEFSGGNTETISLIGYVWALSGNRAQALKVLDELKSLSAKRYVPPHNIAMVNNGLGEKDEALAWLEKACEERDVRLTFLKIDPKWDSFRSCPRFAAILKRIGLDSLGGV